MNARSSLTCIETSSSVRSSSPRARRRSFCASSICWTSSSSSSASTSGDRVGFQSSTSAPDTGCHLPSAAKIPNRISRNRRKKAPSTRPDSTYDAPVAEEQISQVEAERLMRGFEHFSEGDFDAIRELVSPDIVLERIGGLPTLHGWDEVRAFFEPDAFESQRIELIATSIHGNKVLLHGRIRSVGAGSGAELEAEAWFVWTIENGLGTRMQAFLDEAHAREAAGLGQNDSP